MKPETLKKVLPLTLILALMLSAWAAGLHEQISLARFHAQKAEISLYVADHAAVSALAFMGLYAAMVALSLPVATFLTLAGGFFFGKWLGTAYVVGAATVGASIVFLAAKSSIGDGLRGKAGELGRRIEKNMQDNAASYLLFLRLVPVFPFFLVNIVPALFGIRFRVFVITTFFGIIPGSFVYVNLGETLGDIETLHGLVSGRVLAALGLLGIFALIPAIYKRMRKNA